MNGTYLSNDKTKHNARIAAKGKTVHLGSFDTEEKAAQAYDAACLCLNRPLSAFNYPDAVIPLQRIFTTNELLVGKGVIERKVSGDEIAAAQLDAINLMMELAQKMEADENN